MLSLPSTVSSNTNTYDLNFVRLVERIKNFQVNQHYYSVSHPSWRNFQPKWYILMSTTSLGFSSNLFTSSTVSSTNNSHVLNVVSLVERIKNFHVNHQLHIVSHLFWIKFQLKWYLLRSGTSLAFSSLLFLPSTVPSTSKQQEQNVGNCGVQEKDFQWTLKCSSLVVCGLGTVEKNQICKTRRWLPLTISELARRPSVRGP